MSNPSWTNGGDGTAVGSTTFFGISVDTSVHANRYAFLVFALFVGCLLSVASLRRGRVGRRLIAVKTNERAAAALGISVVEAKLYAFGLAAAIAGLAGALIGFQNSTVVYDPYTPTQSILAVAYAVIGGVGYVIGPMFGAMFAAGGLGNYIFDLLIAGIDKWVALIGGVSLLIILLSQPQGMARAHIDAGHQLIGRLRRRSASAFRAGSSASEPVDGDATIVAPRTLAVKGLTVRFGGVTAVNDVSLKVSPGEVVGLIGPNGAGKTTVIDAVTGFVSQECGDIVLEDQRIERWPAHKRARAGVSRSFQSLELFEDITVRENLRTASDTRDLRGYLSNLIAPGNKPLPAAARAAIREFQLEPYLEMLPTDLPYGRRRLVAVARAVASEPSILLLDEPAAGLDDTETRELGELVRRLADSWGIGVLVVEHDMSFVMDTCDRVVVLDFGNEIATGTTDDIASDSRVIAAYLGEAVDDDLSEDGIEQPAGGSAP